MTINKDYKLLLLTDQSDQDTIHDVGVYTHPRDFDVLNSLTLNKCSGQYSLVKEVFDHSASTMPAGILVAGDVDPSTCYRLTGTPSDPEGDTYNATGVGANWTKVTNAEGKPLASVATDTTIDGDGKTSNPLSINVKSDASLSGNGKASSVMALNIQSDGSITGVGSAANPAKINVRTNATIDGAGNDGSSLGINPVETAKAAAPVFNVTFGDGTNAPANSTPNGAPIQLPISADLGRVFSGGAWQDIGGGGGGVDTSIDLAALDWASPDATGTGCLNLPAGIYAVRWRNTNTKILYEIHEVRKPNSPPNLAWLGRGLASDSPTFEENNVYVTSVGVGGAGSFFISSTAMVHTNRTAAGGNNSTYYSKDYSQGYIYHDICGASVNFGNNFFVVPASVIKLD